MPKKPLLGLCRDTAQRFHFDADAQKCKKSPQGACGGSGVGFSSIHECDRTCRLKKTETTTVVPETSSEEEEEVVVVIDDVDEANSKNEDNYMDFDSEKNSYRERRKQAVRKYLDLLSEMESEYDGKNEKQLEDIDSDVDRDQMAQIKLEMFEKEKRRVTEEHRKQMRNMDANHMSLMDTGISKRRNSALSGFRGLVEVQVKAGNLESFQKSEFLTSLEEYFQSERADQDFARDYRSMINGDLYMPLEDKRKSKEQLDERLQTIQERIEETVASIDDILRIELSEEIDQLRMRVVPPITFRDPSITDDEDFEDYSGDYETVEPEEVDVKYEDSFDNSDVVDFDINGGVYQAKVSAAHHKQPTEDANDAWSTALLWAVFSLFVSSMMVLLLVRIHQKRQMSRRSKKGGSSAAFKQHSMKLTPEERQLLAMQQNGFENPTFKFFEKNQVA